jgi:hypothetical protein
LHPIADRLSTVVDRPRLALHCFDMYKKTHRPGSMSDVSFNSSAHENANGSANFCRRIATRMHRVLRRARRVCATRTDGSLALLSRRRRRAECRNTQRVARNH